MANHEKSCAGSQALCGKLYESLKAKVPHLQYEKQRNKCKIGAAGARRVAVWVNCHNKRDTRINVWFLGDPSSPPGLRQLAVHVRPGEAGSWGEYGGSVMIDNDEQLRVAVDFFSAVSFPAGLL